jgi:hypothetical protein
MRVAIDHARREELIARYGIDRPAMNPQLNTTVTAILAAERITSGTHGPENTPLFDPVWSSAMWERANEAIREMSSQHGDFMAGVWDSAVFLYYPGRSEFRAYGNDIERFTYMLGYASQNNCDIKLAPGGCSEGTAFLPLGRGQFIVVFEICEVCDAWARRTAETNFRVKVMEAQAGLPPGATIDPGSPVPPRP